MKKIIEMQIPEQFKEYAETIQSIEIENFIFINPSSEFGILETQHIHEEPSQVY